MNKSIFKKLFSVFCAVLTLFSLMLYSPTTVHADETDDENVKTIVTNIFKERNKAILTQDLESIKNMYNTDLTFGQWAYEYEERKIKYINNWAAKQGVKFIDIVPNLVFRKCTSCGDKNHYSLYILCNTEYKYVYEDEEERINSSKIGTYHTMQLENKDGEWIILKEWYTDPFADSLNLENLKTDDIKKHILSQKERDFSNLDERRINAMDYAFQYCGAASDAEFGYTYNKKYRDFNVEGGDCANFASQILHEGGGFKENGAWAYDKGRPSASWLNADKFTAYMLNSGRASLIAKGNYQKVYKSSYKLLPGDFVAYEKKGDITHISPVSGADSKGYSLVTCHNTDRKNVPWDLGWSNKDITFWLVHVNY